MTGRTYGGCQTASAPDQKPGDRSGLALPESQGSRKTVQLAASRPQLSALHKWWHRLRRAPDQVRRVARRTVADRSLRGHAELRPACCSSNTSSPTWAWCLLEVEVASSSGSVGFPLPSERRYLLKDWLCIGAMAVSFHHLRTRRRGVSGCRPDGCRVFAVMRPWAQDRM